MTDLVTKGPRETAAHLIAAMKEGDRELFLLGLRNMAEVRGGMAVVSGKTKLNRESLYRMLSSWYDDFGARPALIRVWSAWCDVVFFLFIDPIYVILRPSCCTHESC